MKLSALGEFNLINLMTRDIVINPAEVVKGVGDDAAVLKVSPDKWLLFTTDMLIEEVHFSLNWASFFQVGAKVITVNVSDIAAMGGKAAHAVVSLGLPERLSVESIEELYTGLRKAALDYNINIVGGDVVKSPAPLIINVALLGLVEPEHVVYRSGARPGNFIYVTGCLGTSAAGLYLCQHPEVQVPESARRLVCHAFLCPRAQSTAGRLLGESKVVSAMEDISDGLLGELAKICQASKVGCRIKLKDVPVAEEVRLIASMTKNDPYKWALSGGEDFELVFTVAPRDTIKMQETLNRAGVGCHLIGEIVPAAQGMAVELPDSTLLPVSFEGYDHFTHKEKLE